MRDMSGPYVIRGSVSLPEAELMWRFSRSSGPGGQHVNTSDSQVELRFDLAATDALPEVWQRRALERLESRLVDGVIISVRASEHRSQWRNREMAATRLAALLAEATAPPPKPRRATKVPRGINERRLRNKKQRSETKRGRSGQGWA
ncbi:alternative ribosome rescue aminoacyl-tRNA hydrolase ArfB [Streptomyces sp. NRRL S-920]|uniref:alternative ribosome rescue aminoacyl-tRNA hydrolase ArfB n=1 Tax=Streptomyces sp. NRRL S-920 TaxID=1463921 RepID=UPI0004C57C15|nr:alternative ribosome rescue aminoacyl-tRNA hydrolase ArfB [Streptomyces sp. NRRL S-920]